MKLGWNITLPINDYQTLLRDGKVGFGKEGKIYVLKQEDKGAFWGVVGFNFGVDDLPPRSLFIQWIESVYDNDPEKYERLSQQITEHQKGKQILEKA